MALLIGLLVLLLAAGAVATRIMVARAERAFPPTGRMVTVEGLQMHLIDKGSGPPVLLLHGANGAVQDFQASIFDRVASGYRAVAIDRPGHGYSERPPGIATPDVQARLIRGALKAIGVERPIIVAFSWSGSVALAYALAWPDELAGLVLLAGAAYPWPTPVNAIYQLPNLPVLGPLFVNTIAMPLGSVLLPKFVESAFAPSPVPLSFGASGLPLALRPRSYAANAEDVYRLKPFLLAQSAHYGELKLPITILHGDADGVVGLEIHSRALARAVPQTHLVVVPGAGHLLHYIAPDQVMAAIDAMAAATAR